MVPLVGRRRRESGQAMAEYGILLALMSGATWVSHLTETIRTTEPMTLLLIGAGVIVVGYATRR